jgi:hypothetical protein
MSNHTPGPWIVNTYRNVETRQDGHKICHCRYGKGIGSSRHLLEEEVLANAQLIAAAPEMLDALRTLTSTWKNGTYVSKAAMFSVLSAIAKVEGRQP